MAAQAGLGGVRLVDQRLIDEGPPGVVIGHPGGGGNIRLTTKDDKQAVPVEMGAAGEGKEGQGGDPNSSGGNPRRDSAKQIKPQEE